MSNAIIILRYHHRFLYLVIILFGLSLTGHLTADAQTVKEWSVHFELDDFETRRNGDVVQIRPKVLEEKLELQSAYFQQPDMPALPYMVFGFRGIPTLAKLYLVTPTLSERILVAENVDIGIQGKFDSRVEVWDKFETAETFPSATEKFKVNIRGNDVVIWLYPFEYDPATRSIYFTSDFSVRLIFWNGGKDEKIIEDFQLRP